MVSLSFTVLIKHWISVVDKSLNKAHIPIAYYSGHISYISDIITLAPSYPYYVSATSIDGHFSIHDIRDTATMVSSPRSRSSVFSPGVAWMDRMQSIIWSDEPNSVKSWNIRNITSGLTLMEGNGDHLAVSTAGGGYHGFLLAGTRDGRARLVNALRKPLNIKSVSKSSLFSC